MTGDPTDDDRDPWAYEVGQLLTAALARLDEQERLRCPVCGRRPPREDLS